jgi:hypothetical protein
MQPLQLTPEDRKVLFAFNKNIEWLKAQTLKSQAPEAWGTYEDACKILARSKSWYKTARLGRINEYKILVPALLEKGKDWRTVGNEVEYRIAAIHELKDRMSNKS